MPMKPVQVIVRVSEEEREAWKSAAAATGNTLSEWLRGLANLARGGGNGKLATRNKRGGGPLRVAPVPSRRSPEDDAGSNPAPATNKKQMPPELKTNSERQKWLRENRG